MPKIIDALRDRLLHEARLLLLEGGELTIRAVAARCHVAVGTMYNYFHSKDELMAYVMLEDWQHALRDMSEGIRRAPDALAALRCVYDSLCAFEGMYRTAWANYAKGNDAHSSINARHDLLIGQLKAVIEPALTAHDALWTPYLPVFLAETLLSAANRGEGGFDDISPILARLIQP